jgi:glutamate---cysteine ligase / carboxylate-amine ligase
MAVVQIGGPAIARPAAQSEDSQRAFVDSTADFTIGVEEEFMLLDARTLDLSRADAQLLAVVEADARYHEELPASQVELTSPICVDASQIREALVAGRRDLLAAAGNAIRLAGAGTHPFAAAEGATSAGPRYVQIADEYQWAARRGLAWGLHIHVAIRGAERALAVHDAIRQYLPELAALAGNAPFHEGRDTGLHSVRPKLAEAFPRQGIPPAWLSWQAYTDFLDWGARAGAFDVDGRQLWWEVRLHPGFGTLEIRVCDQPSTAAESAALAAVVQALCSRLADDYDAGNLAPPVARERIEENRWRALRHGLDGSLLDYRTGEPTPTRDRLVCLLDELEPTARRLGSASMFAEASQLLVRTGSERQRALAAGDGGLRNVVDGLVRLLEEEVAASSASPTG